MRSKVILTAIPVLLSVLILSAWLLYSKKDQTEGPRRMSGYVSAVSEKTVSITGHFPGEATVLADGSVFPGRTIKFSITPETEFAKKILFVLKKNQVRDDSGEGFSPIVYTSPGSLDDLAVGKPIILVESRGGLSNRKRATAVRIEYQAFEYEK